MTCARARPFPQRASATKKNAEFTLTWQGFWALSPVDPYGDLVQPHEGQRPRRVVKPALGLA